MRAKITFCLTTSVLALGAISWFSQFEIAPQSFSPSFRQILLLTPAGLIENLVLRPDPTWQQVYQLPAQRSVTIFEPSILIPYIIVLISGLSALWIFRKNP